MKHEYIRNGTAKTLTLFHPADGQVRLEGATSCTNAVLHGWLTRELTAILEMLPASRLVPTRRWSGRPGKRGRRA